MTERYEYPIPSELIKHVTAICGGPGVAWLNRLPELVSELEQEWRIRAGPPFEKGEFNFVAAAESEDGSEVVLKIAPPYERVEIHAEAEFLRSRDGRGCVRLIEADRDRRALLIERARPGSTLDVHFDEDPFACVQPAIEVLRSILLPPPNDVLDVQYLDDWFRRFERFRETNFPQEYGERALSIYSDLKRQTDRIFYIHGDFHPGNIVTAEGSHYLAIDPKGLIGHISYDIAVFLNNLHWWQKGKPGVNEELMKALGNFAAAFDMKERELRDAAYAGMVIGAWWNFEDMPFDYNDEVALADIWNI